MPRASDECSERLFLIVLKDKRNELCLTPRTSVLKDERNELCVTPRTSVLKDEGTGLRPVPRTTHTSCITRAPQRKGSKGRTQMNVPCIVPNPSVSVQTSESFLQS